MPEQKQHGGARPNAGRKPTGRKVKYTSISLPESVVKKLDAICKQTENSRPGEIIPIIEKKFKKLEKSSLHFSSKVRY